MVAHMKDGRIEPGHDEFYVDIARTEIQKVV
jgi:hypothetical protein